MHKVLKKGFASAEENEEWQLRLSGYLSAEH
jgi:hypothetical protein